LNIMGEHFRARWLLGLVAVLATAAARADLVATSPFLPANAAALGAAAGPSGPIELRGMMSMPEGPAFCIYDVAKKKAVWVGLNESGHDFVVKSADPASDTVSVDYQGRPMRLALRTAKVGSAGPPAMPVASAVASSVVVNPTPADEQKRLDAVAQEVRRRRMEREKAMQDPGAAPPPAPNR
jgi:hypothetical protein